MDLTRESATDLCRQVVLHLVQWPAFPAVLQVGGIETRASSRILLALEKWLGDQHVTDLVVVPEYRLSSAPPTDETTDNRVLKAADQLRGRIDYAFARADSVGSAFLKVDTVLEVKSNYLCQADLRTRPLAACKQARAYAQRCEARDAYVLYVVASAVGEAPDGPRDAGWRYFRVVPPDVAADSPIAAKGTQVLGCFPRGDGAAVQWPRAAPLSTAKIWACVLRTLERNPS